MSPQVLPIRLHSCAPHLEQTDAWRTQALCAQTDPDLWFDESTSPHPNAPQRQRETLAKSICQTCPVQTQCLNDALQHGDDYGIWGGLTTTERRHLQQSRPT